MKGQTIIPERGLASSPFPRTAVLSWVLLWSAAPAPAQTLRNADYAAAIKEGASYLYRLEYEEAIRFFTDLERRKPEHPGPPLARAVTLWLRELFARQELDLDHFLSPGYFSGAAGREMPDEDRKVFFELGERSRQLAERQLERHPGDRDARYYLGAVEGTLGTFALTIDRAYMQALRHGKKAYEYQKAVVDEDPDFADAYMTVGTYEYVLGNLPWYIKWIAAIAGYRGSEARGFEYLIRAAKDGILVYNEARVLLMILYMREGEYDYSLQVARQLHQRYPENFLFHLNQAQLLEKMGRRVEAAETYLEVVRFAEEGKKNYQKIPLETFRYSTGVKLADLGLRHQALQLFDVATRDPNTPSRERALSHLKAGETLDLLGEREKAISHYQQVQRMEEFEDSHKMASQFLKEPFRPPN